MASGGEPSDSESGVTVEENLSKPFASLSVTCSPSPSVQAGSLASSSACAMDGHSTDGGSSLQAPEGPKRRPSKKNKPAPTSRIRRALTGASFTVRVVAAHLPELLIPAEKKILNLGELPEGFTEGAWDDGHLCNGTVKELTKHMLRMKAAFMSDDGKHVDYVSLRESAVFDSYKEIARRLRVLNLAQLPVVERKAVFLSKFRDQNYNIKFSPFFLCQ